METPGHDVEAHFLTDQRVGISMTKVESNYLTRSMRPDFSKGCVTCLNETVGMFEGFLELASKV